MEAKNKLLSPKMMVLENKQPYKLLANLNLPSEKEDQQLQETVLKLLMGPLLLF